jgi:radical SAM protein with 4Fe4S-binding SPASM domain
VAAFARRRRGLFPIELCNEWGSAGADDLYYRDQPFACGAGRISCVVSATGDVLPCTTTDPAEREGNVRDTSLRQLWMRSFARFRGGSCEDRGECWLQTRNGVHCAEDAFGPVSRPQPLWVERLPSPRRSGARLVGERTAAAVGLLAAGLVFLQGCTRPTAAPSPSTEVHPTGSSGGDSHWKGVGNAHEGFPAVLAGAIERQFIDEPWTRFRFLVSECASTRTQCDAARELSTPVFSRHEADATDVTRQHEATLRRHVDALEAGRRIGFGEALAVLDAIELLPRYDAWFAGHLWRSVRETKPTDAASSRDRVRLFGRLRQHHRVIDALKRAQAAVGEVQIRPWLKKSAPPPTADRLQIPEGLVDAARASYPAATAATWDSLALEIVVDGGGVELARAGRVDTVSRGAALRFNRLDVLWCPEATALRISGDRTLAIPARTEVTLFEVHMFLAPTDAEALAARVAGGDTDAIEPDLALAHDLIRRRLAERGDQSHLRTLLVAFDE